MGFIPPWSSRSSTWGPRTSTAASTTSPESWSWDPAIRPRTPWGYQVNGELTLHGVTKPLEVKVERVGSSKDAKMGERSGFETTFTIKRSDYGMKFMVGPLGDEVQITLSVEAVKK